MGCQQANPQPTADSSAAPADWRAAYANPGNPQAELAACLKFQAHKIHRLKIPLSSAASGIITICEVDVDRFEGSVVTDNVMAPDAQRDAAEQDTMQQATAAMTQYKACPLGPVLNLDGCGAWCPLRSRRGPYGSRRDSPNFRLRLSHAMI